jgi:hypothetical protein
MILLLSVAFAAEFERIPAPPPPLGEQPLIDRSTVQLTDPAFVRYVHGPDPHTMSGFLSERPGVVIRGGEIVSMAGSPSATWYVDGVRLDRTPARVR